MNLAVNKNHRLFNTPFHYYFDRNNNLNCYVSFNFIEFLKTYSSFPEIYDDPAFSALNLIQFDFLLQSSNNKLIKATNTQQINLYNNPNIITFFINFDSSTIPNEFFIKGVLKYKDGFYDYLVKISNDEIINPIVNLPMGDNVIFRSEEHTSELQSH